MKTNFKFGKSILSVALATVLAPSAQAAPLERELKTLLETHPILKAAAYTVDSAESNVKATQSGYFARVFVDGGAGREHVESRAWDDPAIVTDRSAVGDTSWSEVSYKNASLRVEQPLIHFGRISGAVNGAEAGLVREEHLAAQTTQQILLQGITAYLQVARFVTLIDLAEQNEKSTREQLDLESKRVAAGGGIEVDALQAETRLQVVRERSVFYNQQLRDVLATYEQLFGRPADLFSIQNVGVPEELIPATLETALNEYAEKNPEILAALASADQAMAQVTAADASILPKLDLVGRASREYHKGGVNNKEEFSLGLRFSWSFSIAGEEFHKAESSLAQHDASLQRAIAARNNFKQQVQTTWNQVENGKERLELLENAVKISQSVMRDRKRLRDAGKETAMGALDAEVEYYGVLANKINAEFDTRIAAYRLLGALGALSPENLGILSGDFKIPVSNELITADKS